MKRTKRGCVLPIFKVHLWDEFASLLNIVANEVEINFPLTLLHKWFLWEEKLHPRDGDGVILLLFPKSKVNSLIETLMVISKDAFNGTFNLRLGQKSLSIKKIWGEDRIKGHPKLQLIFSTTISTLKKVSSNNQQIASLCLFC